MLPFNTIKIVGVVLVGTVLVSGYFFIQSLQSKLEVAAMRVEKMEEIVKNQQTVINNIQSDVADINRIQTNLFNQLNAAQASTRNLERKFTQNTSGQPRNFSETASRNPKQVEERINAGTKDALRCNEIATGSPLTEEEKAGTKLNTICPELISVRAKR